MLVCQKRHELGGVTVARWLCVVVRVVCQNRHEESLCELGGSLWQGVDALFVLVCLNRHGYSPCELGSVWQGVDVDTPTRCRVFLHTATTSAAILYGCSPAMSSSEDHHSCFLTQQTTASIISSPLKKDTTIAACCSKHHCV